LYYWKSRDQEEVDFVIQTGTEVRELIQVCWNPKQPKTLEREIRSLLKASRKLNCTKLLIITYEDDFSEEYNWFGIKEKVVFVPAWKWMLEKSIA